jgi:hypothetical protein
VRAGWCYERRGIQKCLALIESGREVERALGLDGHRDVGQPDRVGLGWW